MRTSCVSLAAILAVALSVSPALAQQDRRVLPMPDPPFKGKLGLTPGDSVKDFPKPVTAPDPAEQLAQVRTLVDTAGKNPDIGAEATEMARGLAAQGGDWPSRVQGVIRDRPPSSHGLAL